MRVLLVEDDRDQLRLLQMLVENAGHEAVVCATAACARGSDPCDLALIDRHLLDGDGIELARSMGGAVYVLTGDESVESESGFRVLRKPVQLADLQAILGGSDGADPGHADSGSA